MLTSRMFAPPRTCSSATSTAPLKSPSSIRRRKRAEPVTFVRSPISTKPVSGPISNGSSPLQRGRGAAGSGTCRGAQALDRVGDRARVLGRRAAAAAGDVQEPAARELAEQRARHLGRLVVAAEGVRQAGVRVRSDEARREPRELGDVRPHLLRAERAVDADDQRLGVLDRDPERLDRLARERPAGEVDDRGRDPERHVRAPSRARRRSPPSRSACRRSSRAGAGRRRPRRAPRDLLGVGLLDLVEGLRAERRVVDLRAERERDVQRPDRAGDEAVARAASRAIRAPATFISYTASSSP